MGAAGESLGPHADRAAAGLVGRPAEGAIAHSLGVEMSIPFLITALVLVLASLAAFGAACYLAWRMMTQESRRPALQTFILAELIFLGSLAMGATWYLSQPSKGGLVFIVLFAFFPILPMCGGFWISIRIYKSDWPARKMEALSQEEFRKRGREDDEIGF